jgi:hypothetical protein
MHACVSIESTSMIAAQGLRHTHTHTFGVCARLVQLAMIERSTPHKCAQESDAAADIEALSMERLKLQAQLAQLVEREVGCTHAITSCLLHCFVSRGFHAAWVFILTHSQHTNASTQTFAITHTHRAS